MKAVDVLREAAARLPPSKWDDGQRALAAVVELMESTKALVGSVNGLISDGLMDDRAMERLVLQPAIGALANVGAAS